MNRSFQFVLGVVLAVLVSGPSYAGFAGTDLFIPMVGRGAGAYPSNWFTTLWVYNPNGTVVDVDIFFLERQKNNVTTTPPKVTITLAAGETQMLENIVEDTFGRQAYGALRVQCAEKVIASARVFSKESATSPLNQSFGQDFAAVPASFAIGFSETTEILGGYQTLPDATSDARFNIGCVETTGQQALVRWSASDGSGAVSGTFDKLVPPLSQTQGAFKDYFQNVSLTNSRISARVISGSGKVICYGSMITNDKTLPKPVQDPTTFEMAYKDNLLGGGATGGLSVVSHDASLTGDGTSGSPLGVANGGVSNSRLAANAVTADKILDGTIGSNDLSSGAVTDQKVATGIAYSKITGGPTSLPPSGAAGGALIGTYPNPGIAAGAVGSSQLAVGAVTSDRILDATVGSNDLANGAVTDQKVAAGIAYSKITGGPTSLPPSGSAGGSLSGNYPNPGIADGSITPSKLQIPFVGTASLSGNGGVVSITNLGAGTAIRGEGSTFPGVAGYSDQGMGVYGQARTGPSIAGVYGFGVEDAEGVRGVSNSGYGVKAISYSYAGLVAETQASSQAALVAQNIGAANQTIACLACAPLGFPLAGAFLGDVGVTGGLYTIGGVWSLGAGTQIDHPLDAANSYLNQAFMESPERKSVLDGVVEVDSSGEAWVEVPAWFAALNGRFRYQLTCLGGYSPIYVADEIVGGRFRIAGGKPGMRVSWQVVGVRQDPWAAANPLKVEERKPENEQGKYLTPELYGQPVEAGLGWKLSEEEQLEAGVAEKVTPELTK